MMTVSSNNVYTQKSSEQQVTPKGVRITDPQNGIEHILYYGYSYDAQSEFFKPTSNYDFMKVLSAQYDPENLSENELVNIADTLVNNGVINASDGLKMKVNSNELAMKIGIQNNEKLQEIATNPDTKVNLLSLYQEMFETMSKNDTDLTQKNIVASKIDILKLMQSFHEGIARDSVKAKIVAIPNEVKNVSIK